VTVSAIARLTIHDRDRYDRYVAASMPVLRKLWRAAAGAADERPDVVERQWSADKVIVAAFPDRDAHATRGTSAEYQEISKDRVAATEGVVPLVRGDHRQPAQEAMC